MPKVALICIKPWGYNTRRLQANDSFDAKNRYDANILVKVLKVARPDYDAPVKAALAAALVPPPQQETETPEEPDEQPSVDKDSLRTEAEALGVFVDGRWGEARLRQEVEAMRAQKAAEAVAATVEAPVPEPVHEPVPAPESVEQAPPQPEMMMTTESAGELVPHAASS